jgi:hypothetical protein
MPSALQGRMEGAGILLGKEKMSNWKWHDANAPEKPTK